MKNKTIRTLSIVTLVSFLQTAQVNAASSSPASSTFSIGPSIALLGSGIGLGADVRYLFNVVDGLDVGLNTGLKFYPSLVLFLELPIAALATYRFSTASSVKPYVGASLGTSVIIISGTVAGLGSLSGVAPTFRFLAHMGVDLGSSTSLDFGFGVVAGAFTFSPSLLFRL